MGGGPSRDEREAQRRLDEQNRRLEEERRQAQAQATQFITLANQEDPLEARLRERDMKWFDWEEGKNGPRDVMNAPLGAGLDLYTNAVNRQEGQRHGIGALQLGLNESNPMLTQLLNQQSQDMRQQEAAGGLEQAVRLRSAEANRSALPLADFAQSRRMGLASLTSGNANAAANASQNASDAYISFLTRPRRPSFWQQMLLGGIGAAGQIGAAYMGRPS